MNMLVYRAKLTLQNLTPGFLGLLSIFFLTLKYLRPTAIHSLEDLLSTKDILHRELLFNKWPPNIKAGGLHIYDSRDLVLLLETLLEKKKSYAKSRSWPTDYVDVFDDGFQMLDNTTGCDMSLIKLNRTVVKRIESNKTLHFAFVGDSRMRQLFAMFLKAIPDYDRFVHPTKIDIVAQVPIPFEIIAYSELMGVLISYTRKHLLLDNHGREMRDFMNTWLHDSIKNQSQIPTPHPDFLVIGSFVHHMLRENKAHEDVYFERLEQLLPVLKKLSKNCKIIWVYQYPTQELYSPSLAHPTDVHSSKIRGYNQQVKRILEYIISKLKSRFNLTSCVREFRNSSIPIWTSGSPLVEEYIRSCALNRRNDGVHKHYFLCRDYVHPGSSALADMIQILYNLVQ